MVTLLSILIFIPLLIPPIIWGLGGIAAFFLLKSIWKGRRKIYMSVLGMAGAGKTTWYDYLRGENRASEGATSGGVEISEFTITYEDGKDIRTLTIAKGLDIDGTDDSIREFYKAQIEKSDVIFFFFDIKKYLDNEEYQKIVHSRLDLIYDYIEPEKKSILDNLKGGKKRKDVYLIASHMRKVKAPKTAVKQVRDILSEKKYHDFAKQLIGIEMQDIRTLESLKKKLIDKK